MINLPRVGLVAMIVGLTGFGTVMAAPNARADTTAVSQATNTRLTEAKLKVCQNRERAIDNILTKIASRGQKQLDLFSTIATRVETFYTDKGKVLSNYNALVTELNTKKAAAQSTVDTIKAASVTFKCDGTDPKGVATSFKDALKKEIAALQDYKTAVKNLVVGVKSVQGSTESTKNNQGAKQ